MINENGEQLGVVKLEKALQTAQEAGLDLVQVTEKIEPPVCKILNYGKYLYQEKKKERKIKKPKTELKGIRLGFNISQHDLETKIRQAEKFLKKGNKVRIEMRLKGREKIFGNIANEKINKFLEILNEKLPIKTEKELKRGPRGLNAIISRK